ncbi:hypothetical protein Emag_007541 [Eimeria magna]
MEQQSGKLAHDLTAAEFDPAIFERICKQELAHLKPEEKAELLTWLQEKAAETKNDSEKRSANIHVCLCQLWEIVRDCTRSRGSLDAQLYEAQLAQLALSTSLILCSLCQVAYNANAADMTLVLAASADVALKTVLDSETDDRMHLLEFCCKHHSACSCRHALDLASRMTSPNLLSALADLLVSSLQQENSGGLEAAATAAPTEKRDEGEALDTEEVERVLRQILENWKDMQYEEEKDPKAAHALCESYAGLTEVATGLRLPAGPSQPSSDKDNCPSKLLYVAAFYLQKTQEATDPRAAAIRLTRALLYATAMRCSTDDFEKATDLFLHASAVIAAARAASSARPAATTGEAWTETLAVPQLAAATRSLEALQKELRSVPTKSKAADNLLRLAFLLEFEGQCLLTREEKEGGKEAPFKGSSQDAATPKMMVDRAIKEELLGPAGKATQTHAAAPTTRHPLVLIYAVDLQGRNLAFVASGLRKLYIPGVWTDKLVAVWPHLELRWIAGHVTLERAREGLLPQPEQEGMMEKAYAQCMRLAKEERRFFEQSCEDPQRSEEDSEASDSQ